MIRPNLARYKADLERLAKLGESMQADLENRHLTAERAHGSAGKAAAREVHGTFESEYQNWYTESSAVIRQVIPDRLSEFDNLYKGDGKRQRINAVSYTIQDWLNGIRAELDLYEEKRFDDFAIALTRFRTQVAILKSAELRFESTLLDIRLLVQADILDSEIDAARELAKHGFLRGAGAVAGVVLEKQLLQVSSNHKIALRKKHPTISDLNNGLKQAEIVDTADWRKIQRLADLRNLCDHSKEREPSVDEIAELIDGVDKVTKTLF